MDDVEMYTQLHKGELIDVYRHMLLEKEMFAPKHNDGWGVNKTQPRCLRRPKINGEVIAWRQFRRLPKAVVVVHIYMDGVNPDYLRNYLESQPPPKPDILDMEKLVKGTPNKIGYNKDTKEYYIVYAEEEE